MWSRIKAWAVVIGLALLAAAAWTASIFAKGAASNQAKVMRKDQDNARRIEDVADLARRADGDPLDRLSQAGHLRDD